jgi:hypothetical protein
VVEDRKERLGKKPVQEVPAESALEWRPNTDAVSVELVRRMLGFVVGKLRRSEWQLLRRG